MMEFVREAGRASDRRCRLFACACLGRVSRLLTDERSRRATWVAERFADGEATELEVEQAQWAAEKALRTAVVEQGAALIRQAGVSEERARDGVRCAAVAAYAAAMPPIQGVGYAGEVARQVAEAVWLV